MVACAVLRPAGPAFPAFLAAFGLALASPPASAESVKWDPSWPRFRPSEYALTAGLTYNVVQAAFIYPPPGANWDSGIFFDEGVREAILIRNGAARRTAAIVSDDIYYALLAYPLLVDNAIVTLGIHGASDVAFQMMLMNFESYALTGAIALTAEKLGRVRPMGRECAKDPGYDGKCGNDAALNVSFLSGHTTIAFAGAGLMCAHHTHLPLYGHKIADALACATGLAAATTAGVLRVMSDNHYATDVLLGSSVGLFGGYVWPMLWHYGFRAKSGAAGTPSFLPQIHARSGELMFSGALIPQIGPSMLGVTIALDFNVALPVDTTSLGP
jgi:membrane-associated phospholipid phosphatase